jgi:CubicO group peptidase (beta-lactamase class C family)
MERTIPVQADTVFEIGSITRQFIAAAILQLVDPGKLSLDLPLV